MEIRLSQFGRERLLPCLSQNEVLWDPGVSVLLLMILRWLSHNYHTDHLGVDKLSYALLLR